MVSLPLQSKKSVEQLFQEFLEAVKQAEAQMVYNKARREERNIRQSPVLKVG